MVSLDSGDPTKHVIIRIGPKGAGLSTIGDLLRNALGIHLVSAKPAGAQVKGEGALVSVLRVLYVLEVSTRKVDDLV